MIHRYYEILLFPDIRKLILRNIARVCSIWVCCLPNAMVSCVAILSLQRRVPSCDTKPYHELVDSKFLQICATISLCSTDITFANDFIQTLLSWLWWHFFWFLYFFCLYIFSLCSWFLVMNYFSKFHDYWIILQSVRGIL